MFEGMNSRKQGDVGLGSAIGWFTANGYTVCIPLTDNQDYDLVVEKDHGMQKVQVKTTTQKLPSGAYEVELRTKGGNKSGDGKEKSFESTAVDYLFVITEKGDRYLIPANKVITKSTISVGSKYDEYKIG